MTTPNSKTNGSITSFSLKTFPVEEEIFAICLVQSGEKKTKEFNNLCEYIKIIFPEKLNILDSPDTYIDKKYKTTILHECVKENEPGFSKWVESNSLLHLYLRTTHVIVIGELNNIPETVFTNSRIIIFESQDDSNKYLQPRHGSSLNKFDTQTNFIVVDKSVMGHFNIYGLFKNDLIRYDKDYQPSL